MTTLNNNWPEEFPFPTVIRTVVCCDLDETYIPSDNDKKLWGGLTFLNPILHPVQKKRGFSLAGSREQILIRLGENLRVIFHEALTLSAVVSVLSFIGSKMAGLFPLIHGRSAYAVQVTAIKTSKV